MKASRWLRGMLCTGLVAAMAATAAAESAEDVINKSIKAQGGREALTGLKSLERKGKVAVDGAFGQMEGSVEEVAIPGKKARRFLDLTAFQQKDGWDGKVAWRDGMMGLQEVEGDEANLIKQVAELNPFLALAERELTAEKLDDETVDGTAYYVVQLSPKDPEKPKIKFYIDKASDLVKRTYLKQTNPQFGEVEVTVEPSDYTEFGSVKLPNKTTVKLGDILTIETTYTDTKVNGPVDEAQFEMPKGDAPAEEKK